MAEESATPGAASWGGPRPPRSLPTRSAASPRPRRGPARRLGRRPRASSSRSAPPPPRGTLPPRPNSLSLTAFPKAFRSGGAPAWRFSPCRKLVPLARRDPPSRRAATAKRGRGHSRRHPPLRASCAHLHLHRRERRGGLRTIPAGRIPYTDSSPRPSPRASALRRGPGREDLSDATATPPRPRLGLVAAGPDGVPNDVASVRSDASTASCSTRSARSSVRRDCRPPSRRP